MRDGGNKRFIFRIDDDEIGITAGRDLPFLRIEAEQFRGLRRNNLHETIQADTLLADAAGKQQIQARFDARPAVRDFRKIVVSASLLALKMKRTMIRADHVNHPVANRLPERRLIRFLAQRRRHDVFRAFEFDAVIEFGGEKQVLRAGFGIDRHAAQPRLRNLLDGCARRHMHDIHGRVGHFRKGHHAVDGLAFGNRRARQRMIFRRGLTGGKRVLNQGVNHLPIFAMHAHQCANLFCMAQHAKNCRVVNHHPAWIGSKHLKTRDACVNNAFHVAQRPVGKFGECQMETVINNGLAFGLVMPGVKPLRHRLAMRVGGIINNRGRAAAGRRHRAGREIVAGTDVAERHVEMRMHVNAAGQQIASGQIKRLCVGHIKMAANLLNDTVSREHIRIQRLRGGDNGRIFEKYAVHNHPFCAFFSFRR